MALGEMTEEQRLPAVQADPTHSIGTSSPVRKTGMKKSDLIKRYRARIDMTKKWRKDEGLDKTWKRLIDLYRGKHFPKDLSAKDRLAINISFSTVNVIFPSVSVNYPKIEVFARQEDYGENARIAQTVVNYWWRHYDFHLPMREAVKDSIMVGHGWVKVGWRYNESMREASDEERAAELQRQRAQATQHAAENPADAGSLPSDADIEAGLDDYKVLEVLEDQPFVERVSPFDILVDPEASSMSTAKWVAQRLVLPLEDVQRDSRYKQAVRRRLKADSSTNPRWRDSADGESGSEKYSDDIKRVTLWEWYDLQHNFMCVFADSGEREFLVEPTEMPYPYGHPFVPIFNYDVPEFFYPLGDLEMLEPLQRELNETRTSMMNDRKRYRRKYMAYRHALDPEAIEAVESDEDGVVVMVDDDSRPLGEILIPLPSNDIRPELYQYTDQIESDVEIVSGVSEYARGTSPEIRRTATEASIIQDAANARAADKLAGVEQFVQKISERLIAVAQENLTGDQVARVSGPGDVDIWVPYRRDQIQGEFDFEIEAGSTVPRNETQRQDRALKLLQVLGPFMDIHVNTPELLRWVLREGFSIKSPDKFIASPEQQLQVLLEQMGLGGAEGAPPEQSGANGGAPPPAPAPDGGALAGALPSIPGGPGGGLPPEILLQLQNQIGLDFGAVA